ncbi:OmpP1/FadL family transporter [Thiorhodovibrio frisius]|uniref:Long-chain fatty acid transport protein n=1 Tax=Thiorhodovibrio frisius TaxID=631362 RepID=H8Z2X6_9GAMM|nr:outer membrane protein transport protein [Thiorhodovibrio frisius]EIC21712.1 long-chain fatty acid transport protein [Thiorhodovibrio frisius]WPL21680.1 long-chain fatty acid outer membrane transporter [Thiorhodovibrio frisius]
MKTFQLSALALACTALMPVAHATNGYMSHAYSPTAKGMAGAGEAAMPQDSLAIVGNPAAANQVGRRADVGLSWFRPLREYDGVAPNPATGAYAPIGGGLNGTGTVTSENNNFLVPGFGYTLPIDERSAVGIALFGNGGMNTDYRSRDTLMGLGTYGGNNPLANPPSYQPGTPGAGMQVPGTTVEGGGNAGVNLEQLGMSLAYSREVADGLSLGASFLLGYQTIEIKGVGAFQGFTQTFTQSMIASGATSGISPTNLTDNGKDSAWGYGFQVGALWEVNPMFSVGASYRTKMYMGEFDKYSDLFAEGGDFDIPAVGTIGIALRPNDRLALAFDVQRIWYSDVAAIANNNNLAQNCDLGAGLGQPSAPGATYDASYCLGGSKGAGFGWDDMTVFKFGAQYAVNDKLKLRAGYSYGKNPIDGSQVAFNALAPATPENHFTLGGSYMVKNNLELTFWGMYAPEETITGPGEFTGTQAPEIKMHQYELGVNFAWLF